VKNPSCEKVGVINTFDYNKKHFVEHNALQEKVHKKHNEYKETDVELKEVLKSCYEALSVLEDINKEKFKQL
jgi:hypothetical protein